MAVETWYAVYSVRGIRITEEAAMKSLIRNRHFLMLDVFIVLISTIASYSIRLETLSFDVQTWQGIVFYALFAVVLARASFLRIRHVRALLGSCRAG